MGRPVVTVHAGDWPVRKAVLSGKSQRMMRYMDKYFEELATYIRQAQANGQNVSQYSELYDMSGYTLMVI